MTKRDIQGKQSGSHMADPTGTCDSSAILTSRGSSRWAVVDAKSYYFNIQTSAASCRNQSSSTEKSCVPPLDDVEKLREEMQQTKSLGKKIQNLLCSSPRSVIGSTSLANSGRSNILLFLSSLSSLNSRPSSWILDSGAIDRTTPISNIVVSYETMLF